MYYDVKLPSTVDGTDDGEYLRLSTEGTCLSKEVGKLLDDDSYDPLRTAIADARAALRHMRTESTNYVLPTRVWDIPTNRPDVGPQKIVNSIAKKVEQTCEGIGHQIDTFNTHVNNDAIATERKRLLPHYDHHTLLLNKLEALMNEHKNNCKKTVLVVGGGVSGLMTAWILLDKGYRVSIVAKEWESRGSESEQGRITSQVAGALWEYPPGGCGLSEIEIPVLAYSKLEQYRVWAKQSFLFYEQVAKDDPGRFGVTMKTLYQFFYDDHDNPAQPSADQDARVIKSVQGHREKYEKLKYLNTAESRSQFADKFKVQPVTPNTLQGEPDWNNTKINFESLGLKWGYHHQAPIIDTDIAIKRLMEIVKSKGAVLETRTIEGDLHLHERELMDDFKTDLIVNASGLGAHQLANDDQVFPVRGAVKRVKLTSADSILQKNALLIPAQYYPDGTPGKTTFIVPRNDETLIVGSIIQRNNWDLKSLTPNSPEVEQMWDRATKFLGCLQDEREPPEGGSFARGLRPFSHSNVRVAADNRTTSCRVVHNYGHGGSGWTLAVGCAWTCVRLVEKMLNEGKSGSVANAEVWDLLPRGFS